MSDLRRRNEEVPLEHAAFGRYPGPGTPPPRQRAREGPFTTVRARIALFVPHPRDHAPARPGLEGAVEAGLVDDADVVVNLTPGCGAVAFQEKVPLASEGPRPSRTGLRCPRM
jgi:hypothetical protein